MAEVLFLVNDRGGLLPDQTTTALVHRLASAGHRVHVGTLPEIGRTPDGVVARTVAAEGGDDRGGLCQRLANASAVTLPLGRFDGVWMRTNPGRTAHPHAQHLELLEQASAAGVPILNRPSAVVRGTSKAFLGALPPDTVPRTHVVSTLADLADAVADVGPVAVVKPVIGTRGQGVQKVQRDRTHELAGRFGAALRKGPLMVQSLAPDAERGDIRVHVVGGRVLEVDGVPATVARVPPAGEWRSNVALGGRPAPASLTPRLQAVVDALAPLLVEQGMWHVGLDVVGGYVVEVNACSPGGLDDAGRFAGVDYIAALADAFLDAVGAPPR